MNAYSGMQ